MKRIIAIVGALLLLVACSKSYNNNNSGGGTGSPNTVSMKYSTFSPASLQVNVNSTVTWINDDNMVHTVTSDNGSFDSGDIPPGGRFTHSFTTTGTFGYHCVHHAGMTGTVVAAGVR